MKARVQMKARKPTLQQQMVFEIDSSEVNNLKHKM